MIYIGQLYIGKHTGYRQIPNSGYGIVYVENSDKIVQYLKKTRRYMKLRLMAGVYNCKVENTIFL